ncbi:hypothetical protein BDR03DRAFT_966172 [Suillus americanus]|nr:hypothetical protein BDR03DRAFT_966172 [Suillus americanus]
MFNQQLPMNLSDHSLKISLRRGIIILKLSLVYASTTIPTCTMFLIDLLKKRRSQWKLKSARGQAHTIASIGPAIERVRARFPQEGSHDMRQTLLHEEKIFVPRALILSYMNLHHPEEVLARKSR